MAATETASRLFRNMAMTFVPGCSNLARIPGPVFSPEGAAVTDSSSANATILRPLAPQNRGRGGDAWHSSGWCQSLPELTFFMVYLRTETRRPQDGPSWRGRRAQVLA